MWECAGRVYSALPQRQVVVPGCSPGAAAGRHRSEQPTPSQEQQLAGSRRPAEPASVVGLPELMEQVDAEQAGPAGREVEQPLADDGCHWKEQIRGRQEGPNQPRQPEGRRTVPGPERRQPAGRQPDVQPEWGQQLRWKAQGQAQ